MKNVLLVGKGGFVVNVLQARLSMPDIKLFGASSVEEVRTILAHTKVDHVIIGAGLDLEVRLEVVREIFHSSDTTTVHMKDFASGPEGFFPFIRSVLTGWLDLNDY
jgi:hypothetical protein